MAFEVFGIIIVLSIIIEFTTEIIKKAIPYIRSSYSPAAAIVIGVILSVATETGILELLEVHINYPVIDYVITGIIVSRGSNVVHDLIEKLKDANPQHQ